MPPSSSHLILLYLRLPPSPFPFPLSLSPTFFLCPPFLFCPHTSTPSLPPHPSCPPGSSSVPEFFRIMSRQFTVHEWNIIQSAGSEDQQLAAFYRHWVGMATVLPCRHIVLPPGRTGNVFCACVRRKHREKITLPSSFKPYTCLHFAHICVNSSCSHILSLSISASHPHRYTIFLLSPFSVFVLMFTCMDFLTHTDGQQQQRWC